MQASPEQFRSGWFVESVISASLVVLVIRTRGPFYRSRPAKSLVIVTLVVDAIALALPYSPLAGVLGFSPISPFFIVLLGLILGLYLASAELAKHFFYKRGGN